MLLQECYYNLIFIFIAHLIFLIIFEGINVGPVVAGVIGARKPQVCIWLFPFIQQSLSNFFIDCSVSWLVRYLGK